MPFPTSIALTQTVRYRGRAEPAAAVIDWFWHSLIALRADVVRKGPRALRFRVPAVLGLSPTHALGGIHDGLLDVTEQDGVVTVEVTLTITRAPVWAGAAAAFAGLIAPLTAMAGGFVLATALVAWPYAVAHRNFRAYLRATATKLETAPEPDGRPTTSDPVVGAEPSLGTGSADVVDGTPERG